MRGIEFANTFSFLRPNDLVWNYVVDNYLKGRTPVPFDLLYWNSDSTSLPGPMYVWYLRNTYLENRLREPGELTTCGEPVDLSKIDVPTFIYGSREDHIVPWQTAYASVPLLNGPLKFVLGASGHIAGVINPPAKKKRNYWVLKATPRRCRKSRRMARRGDGSARQLVARMDHVARSVWRQESEAARHGRLRRISGDRTGAGALCAATRVGRQRRMRVRCGAVAMRLNAAPLIAERK